MLAPDAWVPVAEVLRPHGVKGELRLRSYNRDSDLLFEIADVLLRLPVAADRGDKPAETLRLRIDGVRSANDALLVKLSTIDDRDRAAELRGAAVCARRSDFPPLESGEFYACDVEGARVVVEDGEELGKVIEMKTYPTVDVLVVAAADGGRPWEVPLVEAVVKEVDVEGERVVLATREGVERG